MATRLDITYVEDKADEEDDEEESNGDDEEEHAAANYIGRRPIQDTVPPALLAICSRVLPEPETLLCRVRSKGCVLQPLSHYGPQNMRYIQIKFHADYCSTSANEEMLNKIMADRQRYSDLGDCINTRLYSEDGNPSTWAESGNDNYRACDFCIGTKRLCVSLLKVQGSIKLAIFPLPTELRKHIQWRQKRYWTLAEEK
jgi:hypothetical protein